MESGSSSHGVGKGSHVKKFSSLPHRYWTAREHEALLDALASFRAEGWKCDVTFLSGYVVRVEGMLRERLPNSEIMVKRLKSKLQVWKKTYSLICGILGTNGGGEATFDSITNTIVTKSESVWEEYLKVHPKATSLRGRPHLYYNA